MMFVTHQRNFVVINTFVWSPAVCGRSFFTVWLVIISSAIGSYWCSMRAFLSCSMRADIVAITFCIIEKIKRWWWLWRLISETQKQWSKHFLSIFSYRLGDRSYFW